MIEKIVTSAILSSKIITIYDEKLQRNIRPTINIFIKKPYGYGFSTTFLELQEKGFVNYINDFTVAGLIGSVKGGKIYSGSLAGSGFKLTVFDEVMKLENKAKKMLLELTEHGKATRVLQGFVDKRIEKTITGGRYVANEGKLELQVHTAFIFGTASDDIYNDPDLKMLLSRCFCINLTMDIEEAIKLKKEGRKLIVNEDIIPKTPIDKVFLPEDMNELILEKMAKDTIVPESEGGYYTRCHDDLIRLSATHCIVRNDNVINKIDVKYAMQFYKLHQLGFLGSQLSETALKILNVANGLTVKEIAQKLNISEKTIYKHLRILIDNNLVSKVGNRIYKND